MPPIPDFTPEAVCEHCAQEIAFIGEMWVDKTIVHDNVSTSFAAMCGEGAEFHSPEHDEGWE